MVHTVPREAACPAGARDALHRRGEKTVNEKMPVGEMGFAVYFTDTEDNLIPLWENA